MAGRILVGVRSAQQYMEMYRAAVQAAVPDEQVIAVGIVARPGNTKSMLFSQLSPAVGMIMRSGAKKRAGGFPHSALMAVTPTRLVSFEHRPKGRSVKLRRKVAEWHRGAVYVQPGQAGTMGNQLYFHLADGTTIELEGVRSFGQYDHMNDAFYASLGILVPA